VAQLYMRSFELSRLQACHHCGKSLSTKTLDRKPRETPELKLETSPAHDRFHRDLSACHLQRAELLEGYCTDDNARAFILTVLLEDLEKTRS